jgi:hypothetical protein
MDCVRNKLILERNRRNRASCTAPSRAARGAVAHGSVPSVSASRAVFIYGPVLLGISYSACGADWQPSGQCRAVRASPPSRRGSVRGQSRSLLPTPASSDSRRSRTSRQQRQRCGLRNRVPAASTATATTSRRLVTRRLVTRRLVTEGRDERANPVRMRRGGRRSQQTRDGHHGQSELPHDVLLTTNT